MEALDPCQACLMLLTAWYVPFKLDCCMAHRVRKDPHSLSLMPKAWADNAPPGCVGQSLGTVLFMATFAHHQLCSAPVASQREPLDRMFSNAL